MLIADSKMPPNNYGQTDVETGDLFAWPDIVISLRRGTETKLVAQLLSEQDDNLKCQSMQRWMES